MTELSVFDHNVNIDPDGPWARFDDLTYAAFEFEHAPEEEVLADHGLRTLGHYLTKRLDLLSQIDSAIVRDRIESLCGDLMGQHFPDILEASPIE